MISDERLRFAVDYIRATGVLHAKRPADVDLMKCLVVLAHTALTPSDDPDGWVSVDAEIINEPTNLANIEAVINEVFRQERQAAQRN